MTSDNSLSLILRRLDEIERKLNDVLQELRTSTAIGYSVRRGNLPRKDQKFRRRFYRPLAPSVLGREAVDTPEISNPVTFPGHSRVCWKQLA